MGIRREGMRPFSLTGRRKTYLISHRGVDVRGVIASAPPTFLGAIASRVIADPTNLGAVWNLVLAAGSWHRLFDLPYPEKVLTNKGQLAAEQATDPVRADCYILPQPVRAGDLVQPGALPVEWTDMLGINTAPVGLLPPSIPLLIVQGSADEQVPYDVTSAAAQDICDSGVPVTFYEIAGGNHHAPLDSSSQVANGDATGRFVHKAVLSWAQDVIQGQSVENSCGSLPPLPPG